MAAVLEILFSAAAGGAFTWFVTCHQGRSSEVAKQVDRVRDIINEIQIDAVTYWGLAGTDPNANPLSISIVGRLKRLGTEIKLLTEEYWVFGGDPEDALIEFRKAVSGGNFGSVRRAADLNRPGQIQDAADELIAAIHRSKRNVCWPRW